MNLHFTQDIPGLAEKPSPYDPYGLSRPSTPEEEARFRKAWNTYEELAAPPMPNPKDNQIGWENRITKRLQGFFRANGWNEGRYRDSVTGILTIIRNENKFDVQYAFELAKHEIHIGKDESTDMGKAQGMKQHAPGSVVLPTKPAPREITSSAQLAEMQKATGAPSTGEQTTEEIKAKARAIRTADTHLTPEPAEDLNEFFAQQTAHMDESVSPDEWPEMCGICHTTPLDSEGICPKCAPNYHASDEKSVPAKKDDWFDFWRSAKVQIKRLDRPWCDDDKEIRAWTHRHFQVESMKDPKLANRSKGDLLMEIKTEIDLLLEARAINDAQDASYNATEKPAETSSPVTPAQAPIIEPPPTGTTLPAPIVEALPIAPLPAKEKGHMTEAPFSANFRMLNQLGVEVQFTIRDEKVADGVDKLDKLIPLLMERGYTPSNGGRSHVSSPAPASTPSTNGNGNGGTVSGDQISECIAIKVNPAFTGGSPQLQFEVDGMEHTINFTRPVGEMVSLLSNVRKSNGQPFTADDLQVGKKFGGTWKLQWKSKQKGDKTYRDAIAVMPA